MSGRVLKAMACPGSGQERMTSPGGYDPPGPEGMCPVCEEVVPVDDGIVEKHPVQTAALTVILTGGDATTHAAAAAAINEAIDPVAAFRAEVLDILDGGANDPDALDWVNSIMEAATKHLLSTVEPDTCMLCNGTIEDHVDRVAEGPHGEEVTNYRCLIAELDDVLADMESSDPPVEAEWLAILKLVQVAYKRRLDQ